MDVYSLWLAAENIFPDLYVIWPIGRRIDDSQLIDGNDVTHLYVRDVHREETDDTTPESRKGSASKARRRLQESAPSRCRPGSSPSCARTARRN